MITSFEVGQSFCQRQLFRILRVVRIKSLSELRDRHRALTLRHWWHLITSFLSPSSKMAKSALRVLEILEFVALRPNGATHTEIAKALKIPKSSLTALLRDLQRPGYLQFAEGSGRLTIGAQVLYLSNAYLKGLNIVREGAPFVHRIYTMLNEFTSLLLPKGDFCVIVAAESSPFPLAHSLNIGEQAPMLASAAGKAILAFLDLNEIDEYLARHKRIAYTTHTLMKAAEIHDNLAKVRQEGISYSRDEYIIGITALAAPVFNINRRPIASISVALPTARLTNKAEKKIRTTLEAETAALSRRLGANLTEEGTGKSQ